MTQLFTEHYMVEFLLHNTLGAWWVGKRRTEGKDPSLNGIEFTYLRYKEDGTPAAGTLSGWPKQAKDLSIFDPCMGSGHFLLTELPILVAMRMEEEGLSKAEACDAVLRDNLFGLEIDARCTQIAAFNLALACWKLSGYRQLPRVNVACSGLGINARKEEWLKLANGNDRLSRAMDQLYELFKQAPILGSLIDPKRLRANLLMADFNDVRGLIENALAKEEQGKDETLAAMAVTAQGLARAAEILVGQFTLVATNVPYLGQKRQEQSFRDYCTHSYPDAKADLATCFLERCLAYLYPATSTALVTPQNWLFLPSYKNLRRKLLEEVTWEWVIRLGPGAFETITGEVVKAALVCLTKEKPQTNHAFFGSDVSALSNVLEKSRKLKDAVVETFSQASQLGDRDVRVVLARLDTSPTLRTYASSFAGSFAGDSVRFIRFFWEILAHSGEWEFHQSTVASTSHYGGRSEVIFWENERGEMYRLAESVRNLNHAAQNWLRGKPNWKKRGVVISQMGDLKATLYSGEIYDCNCCAIVPKDQTHVVPLWAYCSSPEFNIDVRKLNQKLNVTPSVLLDVPFRLEHWRQVAANKYPDGLPQAESDDPTQWLYHGHPRKTTAPLHVALARLVGYRWPRQTGSTFLDCPASSSDGLEKLADEDGIVCISSMKGEEPAAERLRALLAAAFGAEWTPGIQNGLLEQVGFGGKTLEEWLRNGFFEQHCQLFHQRPFIWHIWDGRRDGFSTLVNYHKLNRKNLEKLTYTFLGDWIGRQKAANDAGEEGSDARLQAALQLKSKLEKIIDGEKPYDIFVRWKPIEKQSIGWEPDLNDGVRLNIRPFVEAGVVRKDPKINWKKDRGKDVASAPLYKVFKGERINDHHLSLEEKRRARSKA